MRGTLRAVAARLQGATLALGIVSVTVTALVVAASLTGTFQRMLSSDATQTVVAEFRSAQQLRAGDPVRLDGVEVGRVTRVERAADGGGATVTMEVDESAGPIYSDAGARLRWRTALGGAFFVDLDRGTPEKGPLGSRPIPVSRTGGQVELEDVTSVVQGGARRGLQRVPPELSAALGDANAPASALDSLADAAPSFERALHAVRGEQEDRDLRALVSETAATVRALDDPADDLRQLVEGAAVTLRTTAARRAEIEETLARAPSVMRQANATLSELDTTLGLADPLIARLRGPAAQVAPTLAELRPTVVSANALLQRARPALRALRPSVVSLAGATREALPILEGLTPSLHRLDQTILPFLAERDPQTQRTTSEMIGPTFAALGPGAAGQEDANGHFIRFPVTTGNSAVYLPCQLYLANPDKKEILACRTLKEALATLFSYNPLGPAPGTAPPADGPGGAP